MRILFISRYFPDDPRTKVHGVYKRMGTFIEALKGIADLDMLFYVPPDKSYGAAETSEMEKLLSDHWGADIRLYLCPMSEYGNRSGPEKILSFGKGLFSVFNQSGYYETSGPKQVLFLDDCLERNPDAVFAHRLSAMCPLLRTNRNLPPIIFDFDDIEHVVLSRYIAQQKKLRSKLLYLLLPALRSGEKEAVGLAAETYVCSDKDRALVAGEFGQQKTFVIPNSVSIPAYKPPMDNSTLLFLGSDYSANMDAAEYLIRRIWPHVLGENRNARLIVAGITHDKLPRDVQDVPGVEIPGFVDDLDALYRRSSAVVTPILVGGGTRFKIIEAAAYGRPVVSTTIGKEGIELADGKEILVRDDPKDFARACNMLLSDSALAERIGLAAREKIIAHYDRSAVIDQIRIRASGLSDV